MREALEGLQDDSGSLDLGVHLGNNLGRFARRRDIRPENLGHRSRCREQAGDGGGDTE